MKFESLTTRQADFAEQFACFKKRAGEIKDQQTRDVATIIKQVREKGDAGVLALSRKFDGLSATRLEDIRWTRQDFAAAAQKIPQDLNRAVAAAAERIRRYHTEQCLPQRHRIEEGNSFIEQRILPLDRVGIYVPGGRASYPSSLLMAGIPAQLAGVKEIIVFHPALKGTPNDLILACAYKNSAIVALYAMGGVPAIAAMAYGTETVPRVDKIVGPGNSYVTEAKRQLYGQVGIDMLAGPSEVVIVADAAAPIDWVAADLCAQAEHDPYARVVLLSDTAEFLTETAACLEQLVAQQPRRAIIRQAMENRGAFIRTKDITEALELVNELAPEHVQLMTADAQQQSQRLTRPAAIFCGYCSPVVFGDYCVGINHILPTSPSAAFSSPLGVYDFLKRVSTVHLDRERAAALAGTAQQLATAEGFPAHALSARLRET